MVPAPPIVLNGYADDEAAESKVNGLVTEIVNDKDECGLEHVVNNDDDGDTDSNDNVGGHSNDGGNENYCGHGNENYGDHGIESTGDGNDVDHNCDGSVKDIEKGLNNLDVSNADVSTDGCDDVVQEQRTNKICGKTLFIYKIIAKYLNSIIGLRCALLTNCPIAWFIVGITVGILHR